ncbi:TPA: Dabb family protein [Serratia liquefaciens]
MFTRMFLLLVLGTGGASAYADDMFDALSLKNKETGSKMFTAHNYHLGIIKHIVLFKYKDNVTPAQKKEVIQRFLKLRESKRPGEQHPYVMSITTGSQSSGEKASMGFEQAFIVTFSSEGDRNYYVGTPLVEDPVYYDQNHAEFKKICWPTTGK